MQREKQTNNYLKIHNQGFQHIRDGDANPHNSVGYQGCKLLVMFTAILRICKEICLNFRLGQVEGGAKIMRYHYAQMK